MSLSDMCHFLIISLPIVWLITFENNANNDQWAVKLSRYKMPYETKETSLKVF